MVYLLIQTLTAEQEAITKNYGSAGRTVTFFSKEDAERKRLNEQLIQARDRRRINETDRGTALNIESKAVLTWENLTYDVPVPSGQLRLLRDVFGYVRPGQLTALMGASGAGKTTLLDVLAARKNIGVIGGDILVDGIAPGTAFQRGTSYAEQLDGKVSSLHFLLEARRKSDESHRPAPLSITW